VALRRAIIELIAERDLARKGSIVHIPTYGPQAGSDDLNLWAKVEPLVSGGGLRPPLARELAQSIGIELKQLEGFLNRAAQSGWLIKVAGNRYFTPEHVLKLATIAETLAAESDNGEFDPRAYRDRSGIGRNLSIEVLEYFDKAGLTRRTDRGRRITNPSREIFACAAQI
jgi:selenocysteine-specific elongation factor